MFSGKKTIKIDKQLYERLVEAAKRRGHSSVEEMAAHVLERELSGEEELSDEEQAERRLRGLGYID